MCNVYISRTIPTTLFLKTKYLKYHKISFKFRAITNLSCVPLNPWLIPRINIQKSNLYRNGFIVKKLIYWSEHTHNRPGWRSKSQFMGSNSDVQVRWKPELSDVFPLMNGVKQGGCLSPMLLTLYLDGWIDTEAKA